MPEMRFHIRWPDGREEVCYSPSTIVTEHFTAGTDYPLAEFVARAEAALDAANARVRVRFGMGCAQAISQAAAIAETAAAFAGRTDAIVHFIRFEP